jgi:hypothetical protein
MNRREFTEAVLVAAAMATVAPSVTTEPRKIIGRYIAQTNDFQCVYFGRSDGLRAGCPGCGSYGDEMYPAYEKNFLTIELPSGLQSRAYSFEDFTKEALEEQQFQRDYCPAYPHEVTSLEVVG